MRYDSSRVFYFYLLVRDFHFLFACFGVTIIGEDSRLSFARGLAEPSVGVRCEAACAGEGLNELGQLERRDGFSIQFAGYPFNAGCSR